MNKVYRSVWNESTKTWVAAQENASGRSKSASASADLGIDAVVGVLTRTNLGRSAMALAVMGAISPAAFAVGESGGTIEACQQGTSAGAGLTAGGSVQKIANCFGGQDALFLNGSYANRAYSGAAVGTQTYMSLNSSNGTVMIGGGNGILLENQTSLTGNKIIALANGAVNSYSQDAVNGSQLYGLGNSVAQAFGSGSSMTSAGSFVAPTYKLGGNSYSNAGDAFTALYGSITNASGNIDAVLYDSTAHNAVTLGGVGKSHVPVALTNVAAGAVNAGSVDAINGSQLYGLASSTASALGGSTTVNANGSISAPSFVLKNGTYNSVGNALAALDVGGSGTDPLAVHYDGTSMTTVTLGGAGSTTPVTVSNVAAGVANTDAVNVKQMHDAVVTGNPYIGGYGGSWNSPSAAKATATYAVALGLGSVANEPNTISVGSSTLTRRITNVGTAKNDNDAVNLGQLNELMGVASTDTQAALKQSNSQMLMAIQNVDNQLQSVNKQVQAVQSTGSTVGASAGSTVGAASGSPYFQANGAGDGSDNANAAADYSVAIGAAATATGALSTAIGASSSAAMSGSTAIGSGATATGQQSLALGSALASATNSLALGNGAIASQNNAVAMGSNARAYGLNSLAFGNTSIANATDSMTFGTMAQVSATATNSIALGRATNVLSGVTDSVALGSSSVADRMNSISVGSANRQRQITYVAKGTASTDAVNVSQLTDAVSVFGSGATVGADGSVVKPAYAISGTTYNNVGDALAALGSAVQYDGTSMNSVTLGGSGHAAVKLTNVANGALNATSLDAVNGQQLNAT
ncbi:YadA family autotransporter adhesin, partial [Paraburkholderia unamae]|uniref:YadA family autotransporter adhesin n=1 Tax=Paraburkholderia unamae TaxID=219649 RepID=UPI0025B66AD9